MRFEAAVSKRFLSKAVMSRLVYLGGLVEIRAESLDLTVRF